jgi:hypothetical protein
MRQKVNELELKDVEMRDKTTNLKNKVTELEDKIAQQDSLLFDLLHVKNERTAAAAKPSAVAINGLPRFSEMDRIQRHKIGACPFLRPALFSVFFQWNYSVRIDASERGKRHEFNVGDIHGTATGNLFFLIHGTGAISSFIILCLFICFSYFERFRSNRGGSGFRGKHRR